MKTCLSTAAIALTLCLGSCAGQTRVAAEAAATPQENPTIQTIMARRSVRAFKAQPVGRDTLQLIMTAGINAPSAMNNQSWEVRMVDNPATLNELSALMMKSEMGARMAERLNGKNAFANAAAVAFVASGQNSEQYGAFADVNAALLGENMLLAAQALGIGSVIQAGPVAMILGNPEAEAYIKKFGFSDNYKLLYIILLGYPDESPAAKPRDASKARFAD